MSTFVRNAWHDKIFQLCDGKFAFRVLSTTLAEPLEKRVQNVHHVHAVGLVGIQKAEEQHNHGAIAAQN